MKRILVQQHNDRFINNLFYTLKNTQQAHQLIINKDIYKIYHRYQFDVAVFIASKFSQDIAQFISEYYNQNTIKFIIYHDIFNQNIINDYGDIAINLVKNDTEHRKAIKIPSLLNNKVFKNLNTIRDKNTYAVFLEYSSSIPENLENFLYPKTKKHIRLFNSPHIQHHQNMGLLSEQDKAKILNTHEYFINTNGEYVQEALECGAKVIDIKDIEKPTKKNVYKKDTNIIFYEDFIGSNIL